jgi:hypothetical protein
VQTVAMEVQSLWLRTPTQQLCLITISIHIALEETEQPVLGTLEMVLRVLT